MAWPRNNLKLDRVRALMKDQDLSALICRAPDNVLYLTNYWCMKGYDAVIFPRDGEPTLIALEPQQADAERNSWTKDILYFKGYDERDPRPPQFLEKGQPRPQNMRHPLGLCHPPNIQEAAVQPPVCVARHPSRQVHESESDQSAS